jgi:hypothetical protein
MLSGGALAICPQSKKVQIMMDMTDGCVHICADGVR